MARTGLMLSKCWVHGQRHLLHQLCWGQLFKTGERASLPYQSVAQPLLPSIINFLPPPLILNPPKRTQIKKTEPRVTNTPGWSTWLAAKPIYENSYQFGLYPNAPWAANLWWAGNFLSPVTMVQREPCWNNVMARRGDWSLLHPALFLGGKPFPLRREFPSTGEAVSNVKYYNHFSSSYF